jgi:hypothetical protein
MIARVLAKKVTDDQPRMSTSNQLVTPRNAVVRVRQVTAARRRVKFRQKQALSTGSSPNPSRLKILTALQSG